MTKRMYHDDFDLESMEDGKRETLGRIPPSIRAALIIAIGLIIVQVVNVLTIGVSLVVFYPVLLLIYLGNGALAAHFASQDHYPAHGMLVQGAGAGLALGVLEWLVYAVLISIFGAVTLGLGFTGIAVCALCGPVDVIIAALLGLLGALLARRLLGVGADFGEDGW